MMEIIRKPDSKMSKQVTYLHVLFNVKIRMFSISWHAVNVYGNIIVVESKIQENKLGFFTSSF